MSNLEISKKPSVTLQQIYKDTDLAIKHDDFNVLMNQPPPESWVKVNKYANNSRYLPIEKVEWLLRRIFKQFRIEVKDQGVAFNGVWVSVRVHYIHPVSNEWEFHDGIGATELQVKSGSSPADLGNINKGALAMAFPLAKSQAIKDACDHLGRAFGSDLNRKDVIDYTSDEKLKDVKRVKEGERLAKLIDKCKDYHSLISLKVDVEKFNDDDMTEYFESRVQEFTVTEEVEDVD